MIAHRLETAITYSDKILVMNKGQTAEYEHSFALLVENPGQYLDGDLNSKEGRPIPNAPTRDSIFSSMVKALPSQ